MNLEDHPTVRRLSRSPERANQYPSEVVLDGAWLRRLAANCFVANIPRCISIRSRSGCGKTAGTSADYASKLRALKRVETRRSPPTTLALLSAALGLTARRST